MMAPIGYRRVLICDDDPHVAQTMAAVMRLVCDEVCIVGTLTACMAIISTKKFALLILDLMLPDSRSYDTLDAIPRIREAGIPRVVVVTGSEVGESIRASAAENGAEDVLTKTAGLDRQLRALFD